MKRQNGFKLVVDVGDDNVDTSTCEEYTSCGSASLEVTFDGECVTRKYKVLMRPDFFSSPAEMPDIDSEDLDSEMTADLYIQIRCRADGTSIRFDTDLRNLVSDDAETMTLGLIEPVNDAS